MVATSPVHQGERGVSRKTIAQGMFWRKNSLNINVVRLLCRRLCRDPQKLLIAEKKFQRRPLVRPRPRPKSGNEDAGSPARNEPLPEGGR
jgi:hypothetical protein